MADTAAYFATIKAISIAQSCTEWASKANRKWHIRAASDKEKKVLLGKQMLRKSTMNSHSFSLKLFGQSLCRPLIHS